MAPDCSHSVWRWKIMAAKKQDCPQLKKTEPLWHCNNECSLIHLLHLLVYKSIMYNKYNVQFGPVLWLSKTWVICLKAHSLLHEENSLLGLSVEWCLCLWEHLSCYQCMSFGVEWVGVVRINYSVLFNFEYCAAVILTGRDFVTSSNPGFYQFHCWIKYHFVIRKGLLDFMLTMQFWQTTSTVKSLDFYLRYMMVVKFSWFCHYPLAVWEQSLGHPV